MKKQFSLMLLLVSLLISPAGFTITSSADNDGEEENTEADLSYYTKLDTMWQEATEPTLNDVTGWFSGRCYNKNTNVGEAEAGALVGLEQTPDDVDRHGPLFPTKNQIPFKFILLTPDPKPAPPDYYDSASEEITAEIEKDIRESSEKVDFASFKDGALYTEVNSQTIYRVKAHVDYLLSALADVSSPDEILQYCYYFNTLR